MRCEADGASVLVYVHLQSPTNIGKHGDSRHSIMTLCASWEVMSQAELLLAVTFGLSLSLCIGRVSRAWLHFIFFLLPTGAPLALAPLLVVLELVSYCLQAVSLRVGRTNS